jgi:hypothetical protein
VLVKALAIWAVIALAETVHGILRFRFLNRRLGDRRARQVSVISGAAIILAIAWLLMPWTGATTAGQCLWIGWLWVALMLAFDLSLGRLWFHLPWKRLAADFDPRRGGFLGLGMLVLLFAPWIAASWRGMI